METLKKSRFYLPNAAARQVYGDKNFWVIQTYLSYNF